MTTQLIEFEIVPDNIGLDIASKNTLEIAFRGFFEQAEKWAKQAQSITDPKLARTARLELKNLRVSAEKKRKELKEDSLRMGKAIDGANNILLAHIVPIERHLEDIEKEEERRIEREAQAKETARIGSITPFLDPLMPRISYRAMTDEQFTQALDDAKTLHQARIEKAKKEEEERIAKEKAEAEAREAQRLENIRLKAEAEEREKQIAEERRIAAVTEAKAKAEREEIESEARKEKLRLQAIAEVERVKAQQAAEKAAAEKAKIEAEAKALREAESARIAALEAKKKQDEAAAKKADAAPDKEKLMAFATTIRDMQIPLVKSESAAVVRNDIAAKLESFAKWIESQASTL